MEMDGRIGAASAVMRPLHRSVLLKELFFHRMAGLCFTEVAKLGYVGGLRVSGGAR